MTSPIIEKVNTFIKRIHDSEISVVPDVNNVLFTNPADATDNKTLSERLVDSIWYYEIASENSSDIGRATGCLHWINRAYYYGLIKENTDSLMRKLKEKDEQITILKQENASLTEEAQKCATDLVFMEGKYDELDKKFNRIVPKGDELHE
jgi:hypothetical protein